MAAAFGAAISGMLLAGCGDNGSEPSGEKPTEGGTKVAAKGQVLVDGSTTVYPIMEKAADMFKDVAEEVEVPVNKSGTGSGFKKFAAGEIDITGASRPIEKEEDEKLKTAGIEYYELPIAYDGVSVIVNPGNNWASKMTVEELTKAWAPGSTVKTWKDINPAWPADAITFYGPTENHGTYEYFTEKIAGKKNEIRAGYQANQEYTAIVQSIAGDKNGIAYVGYNYYDENKDKVQAVAVNGILPTAETVENGTYKPLSRPLFIYVSKKSYEEKPAVKSFVDYALSDGLSGVSEAKYVKLPDELYEKIRARLAAKTTGSLFLTAGKDAKLADLLK